jgi:hypothetical protein
MKIIFSQHARNRMVERNISETEVIEAINFPDKAGNQDDKNFAMKIRDNKQLLITYYIDKSGITKIITVITTSKISKYLSS